MYVCQRFDLNAGTDNRYSFRVMVLENDTRFGSYENQTRRGGYVNLNDIKKSFNIIIEVEQL